MPTPLQRSLSTLSALQESAAAKRESLAAVRADLARAGSDEERQELLERSRSLQQELDRLTYDYESVATGIDVEAFDLGPRERFDLQGELQELVRPIIEELKGATEAPRQIEGLRAQLAHFEARHRLALEALQNLDTLLAALRADDPRSLRAGLNESRAAWVERVEQIESGKAVARFQLDKRLSQRKSIFESTRSALGEFFRTRGLNLSLALGAFFVVLFGMRALYRHAAKLVHFRREERAFYARLIDVLYMVCISAFAVLAALLVLYATGDWVLLGLALLFLLGVAWASKTAIPMFLEQIRLLLNFGTVRERERIMLDGVPYRVLRLSLYTLVANAELAGGVRRLPVRDLIGLRSRTCSKDDIWFPCKRGDWVQLSDGKRGEVKHQSPDAVQIEQLGGSRVTYPTADFLGLAPRNLSTGFRLTVRFGIDYAHQGICTTEVPQKLHRSIEAGLQGRFGEDTLQALRVDFLEAGSSSLDYAVIADAKGSAAPQYEALQREIQRLCVDTCNAEGWVIPFTQITLHQAAGA